MSESELKYRTRVRIFLFVIALLVGAMLTDVARETRRLEAQCLAMSVNEQVYRDNLLHVVSAVYQRDKVSTGGYTTLEGSDLSELYMAAINLTVDYRNTVLMFSNYFDKRKIYIDSLPSVLPISKNDIVEITSGYGWRYSPFTGRLQFHTGVDISGAYKSRILATADGVVIEHWPAPGVRNGIRYKGHSNYGGMVMVAHAGGFITLYGHLSKTLVANGTRVYRGMPIGIIGSTGDSTGIHLHYEVLLNGQSVNPLGYLNL